MSRELRIVLAVVATVAMVVLGGRGLGPSAAPAESLPGGTLAFAPGTSAADAGAVRAAVAAARPEARRLVDRVDGAVTVTVGAPPGGSVGLMQTGGDGRYRVTLDLAAARSVAGERAVARLVLHELGHVVDHALVGPELAARLDAEIPRGWAAQGEAAGSSATREERFAESFAKWATGDIGVALSLGYAVPPPPLDWGAPLARLK